MSRSSSYSVLIRVFTRSGDGLERSSPFSSRVMNIEKARRSSFGRREQTPSLNGEGSIGKTLKKEDNQGQEEDLQRRIKDKEKLRRGNKLNDEDHYHVVG